MTGERYAEHCDVCGTVECRQDDDQAWTVTCERCGTEWARAEEAMPTRGATK